MFKQGLFGAFIAMAFTSFCHSAMVSFEELSVTDAFDGKQFGSVGGYQRIQGIARFELNPLNIANERIQDIELAPHADSGVVTFDADVVIYRPVDQTKANGSVIFEPVNRGNSLLINMHNSVDSRDPNDPGNGHLMEEGYTLIMLGWQHGYPYSAPTIRVGLGSRLSAMNENSLSARLPVAQNIDGSTVTARQREQWFDLGAESTLIGYLTYPMVSPSAVSEIVVRELEDDPWQTLDPRYWKVLDDWRIEINRAAAGLGAAALWEVRYTARDPLIYGLGLAAMRDLVSWVRYEQASDRAIIPKAKQRIIGFGASQTGRTMKELISEFPSDELGRQLFDGVAVYIAGAGRNAVNTSFARPGIKVGHHGFRELPGDNFPFTYSASADSLQPGVTAGILDRCQRENSCPKIFHIDSENELWHGGGLSFVDSRGHDLPPPSNVRFYTVAASQHSPSGSSRNPPICQSPVGNKLDWRPLQRAFLSALDGWITGQVPPASRYPRVVDDTLVTPDKVQFPVLKNVPYHGHVSRRYVVDFTTFPPRRGAGYPVLAPQVDVDGNMVAGVRHPWVSVPVATYTGWSPRAPGMGDGEVCMIFGTTVPFTTDANARRSSSDSRLSLAERYIDESDYRNRLQAATDQLVSDGLLLEKDVVDVVERGVHFYRELVHTSSMTTP